MTNSINTRTAIAPKAQTVAQRAKVEGVSIRIMRNIIEAEKDSERFSSLTPQERAKELLLFHIKKAKEGYFAPQARNLAFDIRWALNEDGRYRSYNNPCNSDKTKAALSGNCREMIKLLADQIDAADAVALLDACVALLVNPKVGIR